MHSEILSGLSLKKVKDTDVFYTCLVPGNVPFMSSFLAMAQARNHILIKQKEIITFRSKRLAQLKGDNTDVLKTKEVPSTSTKTPQLPQSFHIALQFIFQMANEDITTMGPAVESFRDRYLKSLVNLLSTISVGGMGNEDQKIVKSIASFLFGFITGNKKDVNHDNSYVDISGYAVCALIALVTARASMGLTLDVIYSLLSENIMNR